VQQILAQSPAQRSLIGQSVERLEDADLLIGRARFIDDLGVRPGTLHATFVRSPHAHARLIAVNPRRALALPGVRAVITGAHIQQFTKPFTVGVKAPMQHWSLAIDRVRYQGEPVAIVLGESPYVAEDGAALVEVDYEPLEAIIDPELAADAASVRLHDGLASNVISERRFRYGDPEAAFATADRVVQITIRYPRNSVTPIECFGVIAEYRPGEGAYDATSNFQGPFALHPVMAMALQVPGNRLRLKSPPSSGGSFGTKHAVFQYIVPLAVAARIAGRPVKWIEDRLEHLMGATSATNRVTTLKAAITDTGRITALDWDQLDDCGAYLRAPEPATLYRMHGNMTGAYDIRHLAIRNRNVLTNKTPSGLVRGFGGPQMYFALERLVQRIAKTLDIDPIEITRRNLIAHDAFPYRTASGGLYDSGNYQAALGLAEKGGHVAELYARRDAARRAGRMYGVGIAAVVEPAISNMGYITTVLTPQERDKAGPKGGALATATVAVDALGAVTVHVSSVPQGQGHQTALAQVVASALGLKPEDIAVNTDLDTGKDAWSVASGNYSSRFSGAVAGAAHLAAQRLRTRIADVAAAQFSVPTGDIEFRDGQIGVHGKPAASVPFRRLAASSHWAQSTLPQGTEPIVRETVFWSPDVLLAPNARDEVNSSAVHGFVFDLCGVEIDPVTAQVRVDKYVTVHDAGRLLNPAMANGQVRGAFANALGAALFEHFSYGRDGSFQSGSFADYTIPTAAETPDIEILHIETLSPVTPLGAKGIGEGNCMSTPVAIANAVADALGVDDVELPLTPDRVFALLNRNSPEIAPTKPAGADAIRLVLRRKDYGIWGEGETVVAATPAKVWATLLDPEALASVVPGCKRLDVVGPEHFQGEVALGVGIVRGLFAADVKLTDLNPERGLRLAGTATGALGASRGEGVVTLTPEGGGTRVHYVFGVDLSGKVAAIGGRMVEGAARALIGEFFKRLSQVAAPTAEASKGPVQILRSTIVQLRTLWARVRP
jgi:2-furoyl-CoA dehydrogenase large subunit